LFDYISAGTANSLHHQPPIDAVHRVSDVSDSSYTAAADAAAIVAITVFPYFCLNIFALSFCQSSLSVFEWKTYIWFIFTFFYFFFKYRDDTAYSQAAAEGLSVPHLMCRRTQGTFTTARRCCGIFSDSGASCKTADLLTYLLLEFYCP